MTNDEKLARSIDYKKNFSISFFNARNSAISLVTASVPKSMSIDKKIAMIRQVSDVFLEDYKKYYADNLDDMPKNYDASEAIARLQKVKNRKDLQLVWVSISQDERNDADIKKIFNELSLKYQQENEKDVSKENIK